MTTILWRLAVLVFLTTVTSMEDNEDTRPYIAEGFRKFDPLIITELDQEYIRHVYSMYDAYRGKYDDHVMVETNALIDTKYRTWKRNADIINSILALPKSMNDAGR